MLLVFWVLWRLRGLSWRETFAAKRWLITGAVRRATAVMGLYLRSFEATNLIYAAETQSIFCNERRCSTSSTLLGTLFNALGTVAAKLRLETRAAALSLPLRWRGTP